MGIKLSARYSGDAPGLPPFFEKTFEEDRITIGNDPAATLRLNGSVVSAEQAVIIDGSNQPIIINQAEGTSINGETLAVNARRPLRNGDLLSIGTYLISVFLYDEPAAKNDETLFNSDVVLTPRRNRDSAIELNEGGLKESLKASEHKLSSSLEEDGLNVAVPTPTDHRTSPPKSFAAILDSLRTDEDRFYFIVEGGSQAGVRVPIEREEMPVGWDESGEQLTFDVGSIAETCGVVRKDWSGVIFQAEATAAVAVNQEPLEDLRRLRDGDRVSFNQSTEAGQSGRQVVLVFREPASLVILDSLMPRTLPPPGTDASPLAESDSRLVLGVHKPAEKLAALVKSDKEYFGAFTFVELSLMAIGTLVGAVIIFLILNYS